MMRCALLLCLMFLCQGFTLQAEERDSVFLSVPTGKFRLLIPQGYRFLTQKQAEEILIKQWGMPPQKDLTLGMLMPAEQKADSEQALIFNLNWVGCGNICTDDRSELSKEAFLAQVQKDLQAENQSLHGEGYDSLRWEGWILKPEYDSVSRVLSWIKRFRIGNSVESRVNVCFCFLAPGGYVGMNAISPYTSWKKVEGSLSQLTQSVQFLGQEKAVTGNGLWDLRALVLGHRMEAESPSKDSNWVVLRLFAIGAVTVIAVYMRWRRRKE